MKNRNDLDFNEFEKILQDKLAHIQDNIEHLHSELDEGYNNDGSSDTKEISSLNSLNVKDNTLLHHQEIELKETIHALKKIQNKTFGICEKSDKDISIDRLKANPIARTKIK